MKEKQIKRYCGDNIIKIGGKNHYKRCIYTRQEYLIYNSRWVRKNVNIIRKENEIEVQVQKNEKESPIKSA